MKIEGLDHPKTVHLAAVLGICKPQVIGHLELLWSFVAKKTPRGDVGKWPNAVIAQYAEWTGDPNAFVDALVEVGFVDAHPEHRLVIHDWEEHAPRWVWAKLKSSDQTIIRRDLRTDLSGGYKGREGKGREGKGTEGAPNGACPHEDIISIYHEVLPELRAVRVWNDQRQKLMRSRWREDPKRQSLDWWRDFFGYVRNCDFLMGRIHGREGKPFQADLEWLLKPTNFAKVVEGKYE